MVEPAVYAELTPKTYDKLFLSLTGNKQKHPHMKTPLIIFIVFAAILLSLSCVPSRQFKKLEENHKSCMEEMDMLKIQYQKSRLENTEMRAEIEKLNVGISSMADDSLQRYNEFMQLKGEFNKLGREYNDLQQAQEVIIKGSAKETARLLRELQAAQENLQTREDELRKIETALTNERVRLDEMQFTLEDKNARLIELQQVLARQDSSVKALRNKVSTALLGYENEGLTVEVKNGKVYVSLEEKLLFQSGSYTVDPKGRTALRQLAGVLEQNPDINIMIEGHTDDVPYIARGGIEDNWDLSVKRATSIVRILLENSGIDPKRLTVAGRGEFMPVDPGESPVARQKNRRTEIILTPRLDEILQILEAN